LPRGGQRILLGFARFHSAWSAEPRPTTSASKINTDIARAAFCPENLGRKVWLGFKAAGEGTMSARRFDLGWLNDIPAVVAPGIAIVGHDRGNLSIAELSAKGEHPRIGNTVDDDLDVVFH
jgi:hypothetical protein